MGCFTPSSSASFSMMSSLIAFFWASFPHYWRGYPHQERQKKAASLTPSSPLTCAGQGLCRAEPPSSKTPSAPGPSPSPTTWSRLSRAWLPSFLLFDVNGVQVPHLVLADGVLVPHLVAHLIVDVDGVQVPHPVLDDGGRSPTLSPIFLLM